MNTPEELRSILLASIKAVLTGKITPQEANAVSSLSSEIHKSMKMEYVGQIITRAPMKIENRNIIDLLEER